MARAAPPLHLALGDCAAVSVRQMLRDRSMPDEVHCIPDDLGHGPLDDGVARVAYMQACFIGFDDWHHPVVDAFAAWHELASALRRKPRDLVVWRAANVSETTLLAMACWWLRDWDGRILVVGSPDGRHAGTNWPDELARLHSNAGPLAAVERARMAALFERLRDDGGLRRGWLGEHVVTVPTWAYDDLLIRHCMPDWQPAAHVIGAAMGDCDHRDGLSDLYLSSRLQMLIAAGELEADVPPRRMREYGVRTTSARRGVDQSER